MTTLAPLKPRPKKSLGQHYLTDGRVLARIADAAGLSASDVVVEVGPGEGSLTRRLVERAGRVIALELDGHLARSLPSRMGNPANLTVVEQDARTVDLAALLPLGEPYKVAGNLPYYAANPILRRFLESTRQPSLMVVMVQREVAQSMVAQPGKMGLLSVATQYFAIPKLVCTVPPRAFRPPPKVTSAVVRLDVRAQPAVQVDDQQAFFNLVRAGFSAPRKQLRNSLSQGLKVPPATITSLLHHASVDGTRRPETLSLEEWAQLYRYAASLLGRHGVAARAEGPQT